MNGEFDNTGIQRQDIQQEVNTTGEPGGTMPPDLSAGSRVPAWLRDNILTQLARKGRRGFVLPVEILIFFAVFIIAQILPGMIISTFTIFVLFATGNYTDVDALQSMIENGPVYLLINIIVILFVLLACFVYCLAIEHRPVQSMGFRGKDFVLQYLKGLLVGIILFSVVVGLGTLLGAFRFVGIVETAPMMLFLYFLFFIVQGMEEEVLCRGYFMVSLTRRSSAIAAVIANSLAFAALHLLNPGITILSVVNLILFGVFASLYMLRTGNIWGVGAIHTIWNYAQGNIFGLPVSGLFTDNATVFDFEQTGSALLNGGEFGPEGGLLVTLVYVVGILLVVFWKRK